MNSIKHTPLTIGSDPNYQQCVSRSSPYELTPHVGVDITIASAEYVLGVQNAIHSNASASITPAEELETNASRKYLFAVAVGKTASPSNVSPASKTSAEEERINVQADYLFEIATGKTLQPKTTETEFNSKAEERCISTQADYLLAVAAGETAQLSTLSPSLVLDAEKERINAEADYLLEVAVGIKSARAFFAPAPKARSKRKAADVALQRIVKRRRMK